MALSTVTRLSTVVNMTLPLRPPRPVLFSLVACFTRRTLGHYRFFSDLYRLCSACVNYLFCFLCFNDFCLTNYLNICRTDLHQICRNGRTMTVDERSEISPSRNAVVATNFCWFIGLTLHSIGFACYFTDDGVRQEMQMPAGPTKPIY